jgi:hypothetical protein
LFFAVIGCATGEKFYKSNGENNLYIENKTEPNSFSEVRATFLYVYEVTSVCKLDYLGQVTLDKPTLTVGLPVGKPLLLTVEFASRSRFDESTLRNSSSYLLRPRPGYDYTTNIQHQKKSYKFVLWENSHGGGAKRLVERKGLDTCVPRH